ncbi:hypothetical protein Droror1_Dr00024352, partial [Drosera rotundifolia]
YLSQGQFSHLILFVETLCSLEIGSQRSQNSQSELQWYESITKLRVCLSQGLFVSFSGRYSNFEACQ